MITHQAKCTHVQRDLAALYDLYDIRTGPTCRYDLETMLSTQYGPPLPTRIRCLQQILDHLTLTSKAKSYRLMVQQWKTNLKPPVPEELLERLRVVVVEEFGRHRGVHAGVELKSHVACCHDVMSVGL